MVLGEGRGACSDGAEHRIGRGQEGVLAERESSERYYGCCTPVRRTKKEDAIALQMVGPPKTQETKIAAQACEVHR